MESNHITYQVNPNLGMSIQKIERNNQNVKTAILVTAIVSTGLIPLSVGADFDISQTRVPKLSVSYNPIFASPQKYRDIDLGDVYMSEESTILKYFEFKERVYNLKNPIVGMSYHEDGFYFIENDFLDIRAFGETREESEYCFKEEVAFLYRNYYLENDNKLSKSALSLKEKLKTFFS